MKTSRSAFWDTSAIVPLCCVQTFSVEARKVNRRFSDPVIWWGTPVEMKSAFDKLKNTAALTSKQLADALRLWKRFRLKTRSMIPYERTLALAEEIPDRFQLRTLDAFQLAAALIWCNERPQNRAFVCADSKLARAAEDAGFKLISLG